MLAHLRHIVRSSSTADCLCLFVNTTSINSSKSAFFVTSCSGSLDYATPVEQQFEFDYDLSMQQDQRSRSPAASPVRHVMKRPRHAAGEQSSACLSAKSAFTFLTAVQQPVCAVHEIKTSLLGTTCAAGPLVLQSIGAVCRLGW